MPRTKQAKTVGKLDAKQRKAEPDMQFIGSTEEGVLSSIASRKKLRTKMDDEVARFLSSGGSINEIESNVMADPPRKPTSNYGSRPI